MANVFNGDRLLTSCAGDMKLAERVIGVFLVDTPKQLGSLADALAAKDAKTAERVAHSIKGVAITVGGELLSNVALECEQLGHADNLTDMQKKLPVLRESFRMLRVELERAGYSQL